jgi:NitT/TauT family transport system ATP-binding protein
MTILQIRDLSVSFDGLSALENFSVEIGEAEIVAILGPSGCGKTTLLNVISGLQEPNRGSLDLTGSLSAGRMKQAAHMHQEDRLLPWRTVKQNALLASEFEVDREVGRQASERALRLLEEFDLASFHNHYPKTLSGGMRRRAALSRTLSVERSLYLFDEPLSGLDYQLRLRVEAVLFRELTERGATALIVTHDIETALALADSVVIMTPRPGSVQGILKCGIARSHGSTVEARKEPEFTRLFLEILQHFQTWGGAE